MEETEFFKDGGVTVTNARFIAGNQTYAMSGITSVKSLRQDPSRTGPIILGILGLLAIIGGGDAMFGGVRGAGVIALAASALFLLVQKTEFSVLLTTASGEVKALASRDGAFISKVVGALNDSIVHRG